VWYQVLINKTIRNFAPTASLHAQWNDRGNNGNKEISRRIGSASYPLPDEVLEKCWLILLVGLIVTIVNIMNIQWRYFPNGDICEEGGSLAHKMTFSLPELEERSILEFHGTNSTKFGRKQILRIKPITIT
jgi:hypothetical protein